MPNKNGLYKTLKGHQDCITRFCWSPDGNYICSSSLDKTIRVWDARNGQQVGENIELPSRIWKVAWTERTQDPLNQSIIAVAHNDNTIYCYNADDPSRLVHIYTFSDHIGPVYSLAWSKDGAYLASGGFDGIIRIWGYAPDRNWTVHKRLPKPGNDGHSKGINTLGWSSQEYGKRYLVSGSTDGAVRIWDVQDHIEIPNNFRSHNGSVNGVAFSPDGWHFASSSEDGLIRIHTIPNSSVNHVLGSSKLNLPRTIDVVAGHSAAVQRVDYSPDGKLLASKSADGTVRIWDVKTWQQIKVIKEPGSKNPEDWHPGTSFHPTSSLLATLCEKDTVIYIRDDLNYNKLMADIEPVNPDARYLHAKVVLLGNSGVGKSGLGARMYTEEFKLTPSTHGAETWLFVIDDLPSGIPPDTRVEFTLWDLAGQPEYRLTHQLFLENTDVALLLFDCSDSNNPFSGVPYWAKVLKKVAPPYALKYLISARCDVSTVTVSEEDINHLKAEYGFNEYFETTAKTGAGVNELREHLISAIPWKQLPKINSPKLFQYARKFLLSEKAKGTTMFAMDELYGAMHQHATEIATEDEINIVIKFLQSRGLVFSLKPKLDIAYVLLKPELINQYGASIIQAARNNPKGIGAVAERKVLEGRIAFTGFQRIPRHEETLVLEGTVELFIRHDLCFREMGLLVFPSQIKVAQRTPSIEHPRTEVAYQFSGSIETIYASLVVQLSNTNYFQREDQWKYAIEFSRSGHRLGFSMREIDEGTGKLEFYFQAGVNDDDKVTFTRFVANYLESKGVNVQEQLLLHCPKCSEEVTDIKAIKIRIKEGRLDIPCQYCDNSVLIPKSIEDKYRKDEKIFMEKQLELSMSASNRTDEVLTQFRSDKDQYTQKKDDKINILHLSDLHIENTRLATQYRSNLVTDLIQELKIKSLEYLVISGDITDTASEDEFIAAYKFVNDLVNHFGLDDSRVIIVPGNHDLNWEDSRKAYPFIYKCNIQEQLPEGKFIDAGDPGVLLRNEKLYKQRFYHFSNSFYKKVYRGDKYPKEYAKQIVWKTKLKDRILFVGFNSSWEVDHHFKKRAGINPDVVSCIEDRLNNENGKYDDWLKIAVFHHPVTGKEAMNDEFMQILSVHGFKICMHGHIHKAEKNFYTHDKSRNIHIVGAGTFGAPAKDQVPGIPLQYNLLSLNVERDDENKVIKASTIKINTRKKEEPEGAWRADARWGDGNNPVSYYQIQLLD